jgi:hypothetical protein
MVILKEVVFAVAFAVIVVAVVDLILWAIYP